MTNVDVTKIWLGSLLDLKNRLLTRGGGDLSGASAISYCSNAKKSS